jgi:hypothetical protein
MPTLHSFGNELSNLALHAFEWIILRKLRRRSFSVIIVVPLKRFPTLLQKIGYNLVTAV